MAVRIIMKKLKNKIETFINRIIIDSQISMLFSNLTIKDRKDKNIVIFSGIGKMYITPFEILIYHLLRIKGYKLSYLIYNNDIPINELITKEVKDNIGAKKFWRREVNSSIHFLENANVKFEFISFDEHIFKSIKVKCPSKISEVLTFKYDEIDFGGIVKGSLYRYYKSLSFDSDVYQIALDILKVSISNYIEIKNRNEKSKIDLVLMSHGIYTTWESVVNYCEKMKINFVCYDRAKVKNSININKNQNSPNWDFSAAWYRYQDRKLTSLEDGKVSLYLEDRVLQKGDVYSYNFSEKESDIELLKKRLNIPKHRKIITIFTNLIWDAANVSRDIAFKSPFECIIKTIEHYTNNLNVQVVIRTHPAEKVLGTKEQYGKLVKNYFDNELPDNVTIIEPEDKINSFSIIELSDIGVVNTSTVGLEFAMAGKPILLISETHYRNKGFTYDIQSDEDYFDTLTSLLNAMVLKNNQVELARKYFYMMMFLYQKKTPIKYKEGQFIGYGKSSLLELGDDETMRVIINTIEYLDEKDDFVIWQ